jgi:hypothetical protein
MRANFYFPAILAAIIASHFPDDVAAQAPGAAETAAPIQNSMRTEALRAVLSVRSAAENGISYRDFSQLVRDTDVALSLARSGHALTDEEAEVAGAFMKTLRGTLSVWRMKYEDCGTILDRPFKCEYVITTHKGKLNPYLDEMAKRAEVLFARLDEIMPGLSQPVRSISTDFKWSGVTGAKAVRISNVVTVLLTAEGQSTETLVTMLSSPEAKN